MLFTIKRQNHKTVMKHKTFILAGLCALGISTLEVQAINHDSAPFLINGFQQTVIIPITTNGSYTVEVSNATGYAEGDFDRN